MNGLIERGVEIPDRLPPQAVEGFELGVVDGHPRVGALSRVHREIGAPQQVDDAGAITDLVAISRSGAYEQARTVDEERLRDPIEHVRRDLAAVVSRCKRAQHGELVTPEPHEQVVLGHRGEAPRDLAQ